MDSDSFEILPVSHGDQAEIEDLLDLSFGLGRRVKTSYRLREGQIAVDGLSFLVRDSALGLIGAISFWNLCIGHEGVPALLLGPLAVHPDLQGRGVGRALMTRGLDKARELGHQLVILVGDRPYYSRVGFDIVPDGQLLMPGPVDPRRLLYLELTPGALAHVHGQVLSPGRYRESTAERLSALAVPHG